LRRPNQNNHPLSEPSHTHQLKFLSQNLKSRRPWPQQNSIEITGTDQSRKNIEPAWNGFSDREGYRDNSIKEAHLRKRPAIDLTEPLKDRHETEELRARHQEMSESVKRE